MGRLRGRLAPYLMILPAGLWLAVFFAVPLIMMVSLSLQEGNLIDGFRQTFHWQNYTEGLSTYGDKFVRSLWYGLLATVVCIAIAYPVSYWIAFYGGHRKSFYLFLVLLPFFVSFILRTVSWKFVLADNGIVLGTLKNWGLLPQDFHVLQTSFAVIAGLSYNFLPFMVLPIYVALERVDPRLIEAAQDLYAGRAQAFLRVVLPLSLPGVFAGVIMTFVPVSADYVNAAILGGPQHTMIGNVIQTEYFNHNNYPTASALSFTLMAILLVGIFLYARLLGTRDVLEAAAR
ncbi:MULTISPECIES: ABC transporter permease [Thermomonospora]|uniref:Binding-protein-dependent transport systems inner membrane component n=1 Tax=Thermomonospora curvata (strain ATCC 19995 / DSM 43183 / JCM 3096 / KCTC 9072 / NBRC 15933 / NCIMB 10081 / Henssen B9) TaxID=471852 RepID=D1AAY9_THECD|nr:MULTISPECIES: ABC transporter permease [Thermomonospora]ACY98932.1 binding-protein-dependent transport systems inner membrane component [Thermomonospora curvata DSM 43183]PKK13129.1 MAG: ABC transporter permease [Thermomonospora sp. CIF 1]